MRLSDKGRSLRCKGNECENLLPQLCKLHAYTQQTLLPDNIPLIDMMPPSPIVSHSEPSGSRVRDESIVWFVHRVHPLDALCRESILFSTVDVDPMLPVTQEPIHWDREGNLRLSEHSSQGFFAGAIKDWMDQHTQYLLYHLFLLILHSLEHTVSQLSNARIENLDISTTTQYFGKVLVYEM